MVHSTHSYDTIVNCTVLLENRGEFTKLWQRHNLNRRTDKQALQLQLYASVLRHKKNT